MHPAPPTPSPELLCRTLSWQEKPFWIKAMMLGAKAPFFQTGPRRRAATAAAAGCLKPGVARSREQRAGGGRRGLESVPIQNGSAKGTDAL